MLAFVLNVYSLLVVSEAFLLRQEDSICVSDDSTLTCQCKDGENITLTAIANFNIKWIKVDGCGEVVVPLGAVPHLQLEEIVFSNINELIIRPFALVGVQTLRILKIDNIKNFKVQTHGFVGLLDVENVIIRNVNSNKLVEGSFGGVSTIENFRIENSHFGDVQDNVFIFTNVTTLSVVNCTFNNIETNAFVIHAAKDVIFHNCDIQDTSNKSFCLSHVNSISFVNCNFGVLASMAIETRHLQNFNFENCAVMELETYAFALVDAAEKFSFYDNVITFAEEFSLIFFKENSTSGKLDLYKCCNYFTCDCNIYWLWESIDDPLYESILNNSYCIGTNINLSKMKPIVDSYSNCKTLEMTYQEATDSSTVTQEVSTISGSALILATKLIILVSVILLTGIVYIL